MGEITQLVELAKAGSAFVIAALATVCLYLWRELRITQAKLFELLAEQKNAAERRAEKAEEGKSQSQALAQQLAELYNRLDSKMPRDRRP